VPTVRTEDRAGSFVPFVEKSDHLGLVDSTLYFQIRLPIVRYRLHVCSVRLVRSGDGVGEEEPSRKSNGLCPGFPPCSTGLPGTRAVPA